MGVRRRTAALVAALAVLSTAACGPHASQRPRASGTPSGVPLSAARVHGYPATFALRPGAVEAEDGPLGRAVAAFPWCPSEKDCSVVLERVDGSQVTLPTDVGDTLLSLSPDGTWLVYLRSDVTLLRNLVTGDVQRLPPYRHPLAWSPDGRRLMFGGSYGGDFTVREVVSGKEVSHASTAKTPGPYYPAGVDDRGRVLRYERPDDPTPVGTFHLDVVDPATMQARPLPVPIGSPQVLRPAWQTPVAPLLGDTVYLQMSLDRAMALLPVSLSTGRAGAPVTVTGPGSSRPVAFAAAAGDLGWTTVAALPGQGLLYRVRAQDGDDLVAVDPATGRSERIAHTREGWPLALAALPT